MVDSIALETKTPPLGAASLSLRRRLAFIAALAVILLVGASLAMAGMRREYQDRLIERAQFEAERALDRLGTQDWPPTIVEECSVGQTRAGLAPDASALLDDLDVDAARRARGALQAPGLLHVEVGHLHGRLLVVATRGRATGGVAWATVEVTEPPAIRFWRAVAVSLAVVFAVLLYAAVDAVRRVGRASGTLRASARALAEDLSAPVPAPGVDELAGVAEDLRALAHALRKAQREGEALSAALAREQRLSALGRMAAAIAHEVRNPLAAIKLRADLVREGNGSEAERRSDLEVLGVEVERLNRLVTDLLGHTRGAEAAECDIAALAHERTRVLAPWAHARDIMLRASGTGSACADVDALGRALDNLIRNAVDASPAGGSVDVEVRDVDEAVEIRVSDEGPGVLPERAAELFEPFFTTKPRGTGLGLSLAKAVLRAHGGDVDYDRQNARTYFTMRIPRG